MPLGDYTQSFVNDSLPHGRPPSTRETPLDEKFDIYMDINKLKYKGDSEQIDSPTNQKYIVFESEPKHPSIFRLIRYA